MRGTLQLFPTYHSPLIFFARLFFMAFFTEDLEFRRVHKTTLPVEIPRSVPRRTDGYNRINVVNLFIRSRNNLSLNLAAIVFNTVSFLNKRSFKSLTIRRTPPERFSRKRYEIPIESLTPIRRRACLQFFDRHLAFPPPGRDWPKMISAGRSR